MKPSVEDCAGFSYVIKKHFLEFERLRLEDGVCFENLEREERLQLVMSNKIKPDVLTIAHKREVTGNYAVKKTEAKVQENFYWFGLLSDVRKYCRLCDICQQRKLTPNRPYHNVWKVEAEKETGKRRRKKLKELEDYVVYGLKMDNEKKNYASQRINEMWN